MRPRTNISGPHSALTDFLASNNISAAQIRDSYEQRLRDAQRQNAEEENEQDDEAEVAAELTELTREPTPEPTRKRKRAPAKKKPKKGDDDDDYDPSSLGKMAYQKSKSLPGQLTNCELCEKRFTVTPYSKEGPEGGLLCAKCSKELTTEERKSKPKARAPNRKGRRMNNSNLLDGIVQKGAFSLLETCIKKVADNIHDIEEFGDLPDKLLHRLSQILSKRRALTPRTLELFLRRDFHAIDIYDCAKLESEDFQKIFAFMPDLERANLRFSGQLKNDNLEYMMEHNPSIKYLQLDACNLISDDCWQKYFQTAGSKLESIRLANLDCSLNDETVKQIAANCPNLRDLKLKQCWLPTDESLAAIATCTKLEQLSLEFVKETSSDKLVDVIQNLGPNLRTLSLKGFANAEDEVLETIYRRCRNLKKLRFADNALCSDKGFANLFTNWTNPPLHFVDLSSTRDVDNANPDGPEEAIGLASEGFKALMSHSGSSLEKLNISSCRHISHEALSEVFDGSRTFPALKELDISFLTRVDDFLIGSIFKCCPSITKVIAFACFNVRDVPVPAGVALIGGVNAHVSAVAQDERIMN